VKRFELNFFDGGPAGLAGILDQAAGVLGRLGDGFPGTVAARLLELRERLASGRLHLAVLGQFKRGKSSLLNALLGEAVLPVSVVPLTAIPTFLRPGAELRARVRFLEDGRVEEFSAAEAGELKAFLERYVTESGNPENRLGVSQVEITHPAAILQEGVVLIDTPGIGSTFRHNTEATLNFLPQCDAALFLVSADPPLTEVEVAFLKQVREKVPKLFFILNKVDYLGAEDRRMVLDFLRGVLAEQAGMKGGQPVFCVSARQGLEARTAGDAALWRASGMAEVEDHLIGFLAGEKSQALHEAVARKARDGIAEVLMRLRLAMRSLRMPLEQLQENLETFRRKIEEVRKERRAAGDLLAGDRKRMHAFLEEHAGELREKAREYLHGVVAEALACDGGNGNPRDEVQDALEEAIPGWFEHQTGATERIFRERMAEVLGAHRERAGGLVETIRRTAAELFEIPYRALEDERAFEMVRRPYWMTHQWAARLSAFPEGVLDRLLTSRARQRRIRKLLDDQLAALVVSNVENLRWATYQSIDETFRRFRSGLDELLAETIAATHGAVQAAMEERQKKGEAVADKILDLEKAREELEALERALKEPGRGPSGRKQEEK